MIEIRFHGRGGQGAVTAAEVLANALLIEGKYSQNFPKFGIERRGAPVEVFLRIDEKKILIRAQIYKPDYVVIFDPSLIKTIDTIQGLKKNGWVIINSSKKPSDFQGLGKFKIAVVDATKIAINRGIGTKTSPIVSTVILGAVVKILGISIESLKKAIREYLNEKIVEKNIAGAIEAYENTEVLCPPSRKATADKRGGK